MTLEFSTPPDSVPEVSERLPDKKIEAGIVRGITRREGEGILRLPVIPAASPVKLAVDCLLQGEFSDKFLPPGDIIQFKNPIVAIWFTHPAAGTSRRAVKPIRIDGGIMGPQFLLPQMVT